MNRRAHIYLALVLLVAITSRSASAATTWPANQFPSANRQFSVELSLTPEKDLLVAVFQTTNDTKALHWSRAIQWEEPDPSWDGIQIHEVKALVANDGNIVVLRDNNTVTEKNGLRIIQRSPAKHHTVRPFKRRELTGMKLVDPPMRNTSYLHVGSLLDFIFEEKNSYALWFGQTDQWLLISLHDFNETVVRDPETLSSLNKVAHAKANGIALEHQPPPLRKMVGALRNRLAEFVPSLSAPRSAAYMHGELSAAYLFLTARHERSDASLIEGLLHYQQPGIYHGHGPMHDARIDLEFGVSYSERLIGDFLWSRWNGDTNRETMFKEMYQLLPTDSYRHLGCVTFNLEFPIPVPSTNAGFLWAYLIPADDLPEKWDRSSDLLMFRSFLNSRPFPAHSSFGSNGVVKVRGLTPGEYRAKFLWERTRARGTWRTNTYLGTNGDYQSIFTQPIAIKAGETITNISMAITNLIGKTSAQK